ncbi:MAG: glucose-1-phosphate adenylyltransferase subunit GlgD [Tissierellia bacterium]|nr:glucose-1-phosphate adenylyltransferase subunit GlgD [Tissierellia bacterium]
MDNCIGVINNTNLERNFGQLCKSRSLYMLPFGSRYRLVDFLISNMVNNNINTVAIYTGEKIRSTMDHLGSGRPWDLNSRFQGLFLYPPITAPPIVSKLGDIADFYSTRNFYENSSSDNVFITASNTLAKVNLQEAYDYFQQTDADITLIYKEQNDELGQFINSDKLHIDDDGNLINIGLNLGTELKFNMYLNMLFIKKSVLLKLINETVEKGNVPGLKNAIIKNKDRFKINTFEHKGYLANIIDIDSYYRANLDLLDRDIFKELFIDTGRVMTKTKDEPSTTYRDFPTVKNSLIANGCIIEGEVENSIIFRGVKIGKNATVKNSIVMQKSTIEDSSVVVNSILDKYTLIERGATIVGAYAQPYVLGKYMKIGRDQ